MKCIFVVDECIFITLTLPVCMCEFLLNEFATGRIFSDKAFIVPAKWIIVHFPACQFQCFMFPLSIFFNLCQFQCFMFPLSIFFSLGRI